MEISTGPVVPFRAVPLISKTGEVPRQHAPLLWMQNVTPMQVEWPTAAKGKEQYIAINDDARPLLVSNNNYVLLRRFSAKEARRRLIAAPFLAGGIASPLIGLENHLNYVHRPGGSLSEEEAYGLAALLNSTLLDIYFRTFNGNTQVSATELRAMPLPPLEVIKRLGQQVKEASPTLEVIDPIVHEALGLNGQDEGADV
jgi:adenine-specific DNA-methyltransferase